MRNRIAPAWYGDETAGSGGRADWHGMPDPRGELLGERYLVEQEIGSGAFSITYRGRDERLGRAVAIKVLRPNYALDPTFVQRFEREARTAASVSQGNVVDVYDFGRHRDLLYIVMQYVEGEDLKHLIVREGPLALRRAVEITRQVLAGLAAIHHAGIIHRDIKPQNVLIGNDGIARVTDFGIAHVTIDAGLTTAGTTVGTASYMAPEQAQAGALSEATDLYAVGVVLYEMLCGRLPFEAPTAIALMIAHIREEPLPPSRRTSGQSIPRALDAVVMRALEKDPGERFVSAPAMANALSTALQGQDGGLGTDATTRSLPAYAVGSAARPAVAQEVPLPPQPSSRRLRLAPVSLILLLLIGGALAGGAMMLASEDEPDPDRNLAAVADTPADETPTVTATATTDSDPTATASAEAAALATREAEQRAAEPTETPTDPPPTPTETLEPTPTETLEPTPTETLEPTPTETLEPTPTETLEPTPTEPPAEDPTSTLIQQIDSAGQEESTEETTTSEEAAAIQGAGAQTYTGSITAADWNGAYYRDVGNLQPWSALYSQATQYHTGSIFFDLPGEPVNDTFQLTVEGMTSENFSEIPLAVEINGVSVATMNTPFPTWNGQEGEQPWAEATFSLPTEPLQAGRNQISIINLMESGDYGLPPYVLLANATITIEVAATGGAAGNVAVSSSEESAAVQFNAAGEEDNSGPGSGEQEGSSNQNGNGKEDDKDDKSENEDKADDKEKDKD